MNALLVIYTIVATISSGSSSVAYRDWRPVGYFGSLASCEKAREALGTEAKTRARCLPNAIGSAS